ncbi:tetratricopeptide repeat-containing sensor histidine kinase [uncultured Tenacibaculum sp.]|uniref:ATP-binding protein n=1 Tax=uncultured Tenacibaculum sp. TaxID=174713 RepID=UPI002619CD35|nr:tetratricopeptide repeat-containing sensor histidine kinase [uncultured Tenacibaculum sp.]
MHLKKVFTFILLLSSLYIFSQNKTIKYHSHFFEKIQNDYYDKNELLKKTSDFFLQKKWDSVIVATSKVTDTENSKSELSYFNYMRAHSFMLKNLYSEAQTEFKKIPSDFLFYNKVLYALSSISLEKSQFKEALVYLKKIEDREITSIDDIEDISFLNDFGVCYLHLKNYDKANSYLSAYLKLAEKKENDKELADAYSNIANLYYEQYKDSIAIAYFMKAYEISKKTSNNEIKRLTSTNMAVVEENRKNFSKALAYRKESEKWRELVYDQEKIYNTAKLEKKILEERKENEIDILKLENKAKSFQRNGFIASSILFLLLAITVIYFLIRKNKTTKIITSQKEQLSLLNKTKDKLFSIVSHDLRSSVNLMQRSNSKLIRNIENENYNSLSTIANKNALIATTTYNLLENLLNWATLQTNSTYFNIESLELSSVLKQIEFNYRPLFEDKHINFIIEVEQPTFIKADLDSLKIIIRNLLDNAIKFSPENGTIICKSEITNQNDLVNFSITDNGIGMTEEIVKQLLSSSPLLNKKQNRQEIGTGLGIQLCKALTAKNQATFHIESTIDIGTTISLGFPKTEI